MKINWLKTYTSILCFLFSNASIAQFTTILDFSQVDAQYPYGDLYFDGTYFYGMSSNGGSTSNSGNVFKIKPDGTGYVNLYNFDQTNGGRPYGSLISDGTYLYGMTRVGGTKSAGIIFKIKPDGTGFTTILNFNGVNGAAPQGSLLYVGNYLYGMTQNGGPYSSSYGTIFRIKPDGTGDSILFNFDSINGANPNGSLIYDGTYLYGMTPQGGAMNYGTIFKIMPDGSNFTKLFDFNWANGKSPFGDLYYAGGYLYGMTMRGGSNLINNIDAGVIFKIKTDGTGFTDLHDFDGIHENSPRGSLVSDGIYLYGMTQSGGPYNHSYGTIFRIKPDGSSFDTLLTFNGKNGANPYGSLISDGTFFYGMSNVGGSPMYGNIFKIKPDGTGFSNVVNFSSSTGNSAMGSLIFDGTFLYGMTQLGGSFGSGNVFKIKPDGSDYLNLIDFDGTNGSQPYGSLISDGTYLYGMTNQGGKYNIGNVFKIKTDGTSFDTLISFNRINGSNPKGSLLYDGTFLYGMTSGKQQGYGNIFKIKPDGTGFTSLFSFDGTTASNPYGSLISDGTYLYGMTSGNSNGVGNIFKIKSDGTGYMNLKSFTNGENPNGDLLYDGTDLYGVTVYGGNGTGEGTLFKIKPDGSGFTQLVDFYLQSNMTNQSQYPYGSLIVDQGVLYGLLQLGGIFSVNKDGSGFSFLHSFNGAYGSLITDGSNLYGMSSVGGANNLGMVFKFHYCNAVTNSNSSTICFGQKLNVGAHTYSISGIYSDIFTAANGCDSIIVTHLNVLPAKTFTQSLTLCAGHSIIVGANTYTASATYSDTLKTLVTGCDSTVTTNLTVLSTNSYTQSINTCSIKVGSHIYSVGGTYLDTLIDKNGCDSIIITYLTLPNNCQPITRIETYVSETNIEMFPNPTSGQFNITMKDATFKKILITIVDVQGKEVFKSEDKNNISNFNKTINLENLSDGMYYIKLSSEVGTSVQKILLQK